MIVTIWRHGEAEAGANDPLRELTETGRDDVGFGCRQLHRVCTDRKIPHPGKILHSPLLRTLQTAEIVAAAYTHAGVVPVAALQPGGTVKAVATEVGALVASHPANVHWLLVSHQPLVSRLVDHYLGDKGRVPALPPGGLATLSMDELGPGCAQLLFWAFPPEFEAVL
ncbi:MAG: histidine phosphatase family protein [Halioglobus sp.]